MQAHEWQTIRDRKVLSGARRRGLTCSSDHPAEDCALAGWITRHRGLLPLDLSVRPPTGRQSVLLPTLQSDHHRRARLPFKAIEESTDRASLGSSEFVTTDEIIGAVLLVDLESDLFTVGVVHKVRPTHKRDLRLDLKLDQKTVV